MSTRTLTRRLSLLSLLTFSALAKATEINIELWTRQQGSHTGAARGREQRKVIDVSTFEAVDAELDDAQLGAKRRYRAIKLESLLNQAAPDAKLDTAILHFRNGMAVPIPFRDAQAMARLNLSLALAVEVDGTMSTAFPPLRKEGAETRDKRPIFFDGNKIVAPTLWHPLVGDKAIQAFSPWKHVDRLEGIEFVNWAAYTKQFTFGRTPDVARGQDLFLARCAFCHGVRKVGADFGWDFVEPVAVSTYRSAPALLTHMKYKLGDAPERGLMMPNFADVTEADAKALWKFLDAAAKTEPKAYVP